MREIIFFGVFLIGAIASIHIDEERINSRVDEIFDKNFDNRQIVNLISTTSEPCTCVPFAKCANGATELSIRFSAEDECPFLQMCCPKHLIKGDKCSPGTYINVGCGIHNKNGVCFNITDDKENEAKFGEFPWMVALLEELRFDGEHFLNYICGGSLIAPGVVLTAAHCIHGKRSKILKIRAGEWDTQTTNEPFPYQDRLVSDYVIHPDFIRENLYYDVALLFLQQPVNIADNVNTICLPNVDDIFDHAQCLSSGWGNDLFGDEENPQVILKRIELPVVPFKSCNQKLKQTRLGRYFQLHPSFICAGGEPGHDMCTGDGGSPLVCPILNAPGRYAQAGIVSAGVGCGNSIPGVYASVPFIRSWIDEQMKLNNLMTNSYTYQ